MKNLLKRIKRTFFPSVPPMPPTDKEVQERRRAWIKRKNLTVSNTEADKIINAFIDQCEETDFKLPCYGVPDRRYYSCCKANPDHKHFAHCAYIKAKEYKSRGESPFKENMK